MFHKDLSSEEFRKYAVHHKGLNGLAVDQYMNQMGGTSRPFIEDMTQYIIEERPMRFAQIDVFSRLIMDRIIFMGVPVDDYMANIIVAQLLFMESTDSKKDIMMYINSPGGSVYAGLGIYDTMHLIRPDVCTICTSLAASMGAVLLAGGQAGKRCDLPSLAYQPGFCFLVYGTGVMGSSAFLGSSSFCHLAASFGLPKTEYSSTSLCRASVRRRLDVAGILSSRVLIPS